MAVQSKASKTSTSGVKLDTSGDQFSITLPTKALEVAAASPLNSQAPTVAQDIHSNQDPSGQVIFGTGAGGGGGGGGGGDTVKPTWDNTSYSFNYVENKLAQDLIATITGASDNTLVTQYRFVNEDASILYGTTSGDLYFSIGADGKITITSKGAGAGVNDYDDGITANIYYIQAGDAAENWSDIRQITLNETNDIADDNTGGASITNAYNNMSWGEGGSTMARYIEQGNTRDYVANSGMAISFQDPTVYAGDYGSVDAIIVDLGLIQGFLDDYQWSINGNIANSWGKYGTNYVVCWHDESLFSSGQTVTVDLIGVGTYTGTDYALSATFA